MDLDALVPLIVAAVGLGGLVFTALRFRREDTSSLVQQHSVVLAGMKTLMDEREKEREEDRREVVRLRAEIDDLKHQVARELAVRRELEDEVKRHRVVRRELNERIQEQDAEIVRLRRVAGA